MSEHDNDVAEALRVVAEDGRVVAEHDRVEAEGGSGSNALELGRIQAEAGRVQAEHGDTGRVQAEDQRVVAEEGREANRHRMYRRVAVLVALPVAFVALIPSTIGIVLVKRQADSNRRAGIALANEVHTRCADAQLNRAAIRTTLIGGLSALGYRYSNETGQAIEAGVPLAYYKDHPDERARQLESSLETIQRFPPITCD